MTQTKHTNAKNKIITIWPRGSLWTANRSYPVPIRIIQVSWKKPVVLKRKYKCWKIIDDDVEYKNRYTIVCVGNAYICSNVWNNQEMLRNRNTVLRVLEFEKKSHIQRRVCRVPCVNKCYWQRSQQLLIIIIILNCSLRQIRAALAGWW